MNKSNKTKKTTAVAIASIANANIQIGTREVVSVAVARVEVSLKGSISETRKKVTALEEQSKAQDKALAKAVIAQGKEASAGAMMHATSLMNMTKDLFAIKEEYCLHNRVDGDGNVTERYISISISLNSKNTRRYSSDDVTVFSCEANACQEVLDKQAELAATQEEIDKLREEISALNKQLANIPYAERQFTARMAEKILAGTEGGQAMLSQVDAAIQAMGFGDLPMLTEVK
jgi:vacuolar-type H+-ATPase subunit D/Vma8